MRFRKSERLLHWCIAVPFMVCFGSALVLLFFYNPFPERSYRELFSWIHRVSGVCLITLPLLAVIRSRSDYRIYFHNIQQAWIWTIEDMKWLLLMGLAAMSKKIQLPEQGKFNAAEKINFMVLMVTYPLYIVTGLLLWVTHGALLSWFLHLGMAAMATPLLVGHLFMALVNPGTRPGLSGMTNGFVDSHWAKHHYTRWFREHVEDNDTVMEEEAAPSVVD